MLYSSALTTKYLPWFLCIFVALLEGVFLFQKLSLIDVQIDNNCLKKITRDSDTCNQCLSNCRWRLIFHQMLLKRNDESPLLVELWILQSIACLQTGTGLLIILTESFSYKSKIYLLLAALERSQLSKLLCCYHKDGWDSLDLCELASKEVVFSERGAYPSPLNSKL